MNPETWCPQTNDIILRKGNRTSGTFSRVVTSTDDEVKVLTFPVGSESYEQRLRLSTVVSHYELLNRS